MTGLESYCLACDRQLAAPAVYCRERGPFLHVPVLLGVLWLAVVLGVPALIVAEVVS
jgi:hypothetical protein